VLAQQRFNYLREPLRRLTPSPTAGQVPIQLRVYAGSQPARSACCSPARRRGCASDAGAEAVVPTRAARFYRVRYAPDLLDALLRRLAALAPIERFNLVNDAWRWRCGG